ncbi:MAG: MGMT family protein [Chloroflexi bacterium]|nr:MGMT family protein [Chloroflexota bacterium]
MTLQTSAGPLRVAYRDGAVCLALLDAGEETFLSECRRRLGEEPRFEDSFSLRQLLEVRLGSDTAVPFDLSACTDFQRKTLEAVASIPRGEVRTYAEVAALIGRPGAARAVGEVMRTNPIPVLIPCHRVVRSGGRLGNYSPRPELKRQFLIEEGAIRGQART